MRDLNIKLEKITNQKDLRLKRLLQFYQYDWSEISNESKLSTTGLYHYIDLNKFWRFPRSKVFLIKVSDEIAGFVMLKKHSFLSDEKPVMAIDEFFVMRKFRKQNIGTEVAIKLFNTFRGAWQVSETVENKGAQKFWRKVISSYTKNHYKEVLSKNKLYHEYVQVFKS